MNAKQEDARRGEHTMFLRNDTLLSGIGLPKLPLRATTLGVIVPVRPAMTDVWLHYALELSLPHVKEKAKFLSVNSQQLLTKGAAIDVLFADDCPTTRSIIRKSLCEWGYTPFLATNGEEALEMLLAPEGPRLAVLDWTMPILEGPEVCRRLREVQDPDRYTYVIFLTAKTADEDLAHAIAAGADEFVTKPVKETDLNFRLANGKRTIELRDELVRARSEIARLQDQLADPPVETGGFFNRLLS